MLPLGGVKGRDAWSNTWLDSIDEFYQSSGRGREREKGEEVTRYRTGSRNMKWGGGGGGGGAKNYTPSQKGGFRGGCLYRISVERGGGGVCTPCTPLPWIQP